MLDWSLKLKQRLAYLRIEKEDLVSVSGKLGSVGVSTVRLNNGVAYVCFRLRCSINRSQLQSIWQPWKAECLCLTQQVGSCCKSTSRRVSCKSKTQRNSLVSLDAVLQVGEESPCPAVWCEFHQNFPILRYLNANNKSNFFFLTSKCLYLLFWCLLIPSDWDIGMFSLRHECVTRMNAFLSYCVLCYSQWLTW